MPTFEVEVHRIAVSDHTFQVEAATESEARKIALEQAGDCGDYREISVQHEVETSTRIPDEQDECTLPAMLKNQLRDGLRDIGQEIIADQVFLGHPNTLTSEDVARTGGGCLAYHVDIRNLRVIWTDTNGMGLPTADDYRVGVYLNAGPEHELELLHEQSHYRDTPL